MENMKLLQSLSYRNAKLYDTLDLRMVKGGIKVARTKTKSLEQCTHGRKALSGENKSEMLH